MDGEDVSNDSFDAFRQMGVRQTIRLIGIFQPLSMCRFGGSQTETEILCLDRLNEVGQYR